MFRKFDVNLSPYVDCDIYHKTLRVEGRISREEALRRLNHAGIATKDIEGMYREGENSPWNAVLFTKEQAYGVQAEGIKYLAKMVVDLRVHWLPLYISDDIIKEVLSPFVKVLDITRDKTVLDKDVVTFNGTRLVKLQTTEFDSRNIPHIVSLGQCRMLITMKDRAPICLKCRQSGHLRKDCPEKTASYASVATPRRTTSQLSSSPAAAAPTTPAPQVVEPQDISVSQEPEQPETIVDNVIPVPPIEVTSITSCEPVIPTTEKRTELFDVETGSWEVVRNKKRLKSSPADDDDFMDTSTVKTD
ncbi:hypothetical protein ACJMK2_035635 [Sinanodonta woodiana]|uniref:CCHC-type domain-containing protein n=1 Tax=Sinanodonta woodiana TaxID=1069815 RepID=A0ABD3WVJ6_SINWO